MIKRKDSFKNIIDYKVKAYQDMYGEKTIEELVKEIENSTYFDSHDYVEISYINKKNEVRRIKILGELYEYGEYMISKINESFDITLIRVVNGVYHPLESHEKGMYL